jgi:hypothetical protein
MSKTTCIVCGIETEEITEAFCCPKCYNEGSDPHMLVSMTLIKNTPNDGDLGGEIRKRYWILNN